MQKISKKVSCTFDYDSKKDSPRKNRLQKEQNLLESLKNHAKVKEKKLTRQSMRPRLHLLNVQKNPWNYNFTVKWNFMGTSIFTFDSICFSPEFREKLSNRIDTKEPKNYQILSILYSKPLRDFEKPKLKVVGTMHFWKSDLSVKNGCRRLFT